jgi:hypothetical protein
MVTQLGYHGSNVALLAMFGHLRALLLMLPLLNAKAADAAQ